jgi:hypothetical protein
MNKFKNVFTFFVILFLALNSVSCVTFSWNTQEKNFQDPQTVGTLTIINHGGLVLSTPFDNVKYFIDGVKVASHHSDANFEKMLQLQPGEHSFIVEYGKNYKCTYSFIINRGQTGTFDNYNYYTFVMSKADKNNIGHWGFNDVGALALEKNIGKNNCPDIKNDTGRKICKEYYDNLCR